MSTSVDIFQSMVNSGQYDYDIKHAADPSAFRTRFTDALLQDPENFAILVGACWMNGAQNELQAFLKSEKVARNIKALECANYCHKSVLEEDAYLFLRSAESAMAIGQGVARLVLERAHTLFDEMLKDYRMKQSFKIREVS